MGSVISTCKYACKRMLGRKVIKREKPLSNWKPEYSSYIDFSFAYQNETCYDKVYLMGPNPARWLKGLRRHIEELVGTDPAALHAFVNYYHDSFEPGNCQGLFAAWNTIWIEEQSFVAVALGGPSERKVFFAFIEPEAEDEGPDSFCVARAKRY